MINITNRQRNTNQKQNEVSPHTHQDGYYQNRKQVLVRMWRNLEPLCTVGGIVKWCKHYGKHCKGSSKNRTTIRFSNHAWVHSWPSNNMGLKSTYTWIQWIYLYVDFFSTVNTTVLHMIQDWMNLWMWKNPRFGVIGDTGGQLWIFSFTKGQCP